MLSNFKPENTDGENNINNILSNHNPVDIYNIKNQVPTKFSKDKLFNIKLDSEKVISGTGDKNKQDLNQNEEITNRKRFNLAPKFKANNIYNNNLTFLANNANTNRSQISEIESRDIPVTPIYSSKNIKKSMGFKKVKFAKKLVTIIEIESFKNYNTSEYSDDEKADTKCSCFIF